MALSLIWAYVLIRPMLLWDWLYYHDTPLLNYAAVLMHDFGRIPYRDIFETTMPGTFLFHYIIVGLGLEAQTSFVALGLLAMFALAAGGSLILWRLLRPAGLLFAPFFLMVILQFGPTALFQREVLGLLAMLTGLLVATQGTIRRPLLRQFLVGLAFGVAATIKPQFAFGAPVAVLCLAALSHESGRPVMKTTLSGIMASLLGFALPLGVAFLWLWTSGALPYFWFILSEYTALYLQQTQAHVFTTPERRLRYLFEIAPTFAGFWPLLPGVLILALVLRVHWRDLPRQTRIIVTSILALTVVYGAVPILSGQFWDYHYFPFIFFAILSTSALFGLLWVPFWNEGRRFACLAVVVLTLALNVAPVGNLEWRQQDARDRIALAFEMESALRKWVPEGGSVQPIDWTAGALHAMMRARVPIATRFFYDFHFAHHVSSDVTKGLRAEFIAALEADPPEVMLIAHGRVKVFGIDASYDFPELERFMDTRYLPVETNARFDILVRRDLAS